MIAKHKIQSPLLPRRISLLLKDFQPVKTHLSQPGTSLESYLLCAVISNYDSMEKWLTFSALPLSEKWVGGCQSNAAVWAATAPTVPAKLQSHESQAHASLAAMLTLEEDERERRRQTSKALDLAVCWTLEVNPGLCPNAFATRWSAGLWKTITSAHNVFFVRYLGEYQEMVFTKRDLN